jgi:ketosteroid isomerase-like protein
VIDSEGAVIHAIMDMRFVKDAPPDFALGLRKAGERVKTRFCGFYRLRGDKICEFRVFPFLGETLD